MGPARFKVYLRKGVFTVVSYAPVMGHSPLTILTDTAYDYGFTLTGNGSVNSACFGYLSCYCRIVDLFTFALQGVCGKGIFRNCAKPRSITVKAVHRTESKVRKHSRKLVAESVALMLYRRMNGHPRGLIENYHAVAFICSVSFKVGIRFKEAVITEAQNYDIAFVNGVDASDGLAVTCYTSVYAFKLC